MIRTFDRSQDNRAHHIDGSDVHVKEPIKPRLMTPDPALSTRPQRTLPTKFTRDKMVCGHLTIAPASYQFSRRCEGCSPDLLCSCGGHVVSCGHFLHAKHECVQLTKQPVRRLRRE